MLNSLPFNVHVAISTFVNGIMRTSGSQMKTAAQAACFTFGERVGLVNNVYEIYECVSTKYLGKCNEKPNRQLAK